MQGLVIFFLIAVSASAFRSNYHAAAKKSPKSSTCFMSLSKPANLSSSTEQSSPLCLNDNKVTEMVAKFDSLAWNTQVDVGALHADLMNLDETSSKKFMELLLVKNLWLFDRLFSFLHYCIVTDPSTRNIYRNRGNKEEDQLCVCWTNPFSLLNASSILVFMNYFQPSLATGDCVDTTVINALVNHKLSYVYLEGKTWGQVKNDWLNRPEDLKVLPDESTAIVGYDSVGEGVRGVLIRAPSTFTIQRSDGTKSEVSLPWTIKTASARKEANKTRDQMRRRWSQILPTRAETQRFQRVESPFPEPVCHRNSHFCIFHQQIVGAVGIALGLPEGDERDKFIAQILFLPATDQNMQAMGLALVRTTVFEAPSHNSSGSYVLLMSYQDGAATIMRSNKMYTDIAR